MYHQNSGDTIPDYVWKILKDKRITNTQKYFFMVILALDTEQDCPDVIELPVRSFEEFGVAGHGHVKHNLNSLKAAGYLLDVGWTQRKDGYRITCVVINRQFAQMFAKEEEAEEEDDPEDVA